MTAATRVIGEGDARRLHFGFDRFSGLYVWGAIILIFALWVPRTFLTVTTLKVVAGDQAITAMLALGLVVPFAAGVFDLSIAHTLGFSMVLVSWLTLHTGWNAAGCALLTVAVCSVVGAINAVVVTRAHVSSFIATLGMSSLLLAGAEWISSGQQISGGISADFARWGQGTLVGIPIPFYFVVIIGSIVFYVTEHTPAGRYLYATGGNPDAARLAGIRTDRLVAISLVTSATVAGFAGVIFAARVGISSNSAGPPFLLPAFAAVFLGSTQFRNGRVNALGTVIGAYLLATGVKGLQLVQVGPWVGDAFNGGVLIVAVTLAVRSGRLQRSTSR